MKNKLLLSVLFCMLLPCVCYSQLKIEDDVDSYLSDYRNFRAEDLNVKEFSTAMDTVFLAKHKRKPRGCDLRVSRNLDFGLTESIYSLVIPAIEGVSFYTLRRDIHVLSDESGIVGIMSTKGYNGINSVFFDESAIQKYVMKHDSVYQTKTTIDDFVNDLLDCYVYGYSCDNAPVIIDVNIDAPIKFGLKFNDRSNINIFRKWIRSYNVELQTYGVDALDCLYRRYSSFLSAMEKQKVENDKQLINLVKVRNSRIALCDGCFIGFYGTVFGGKY